MGALANMMEDANDDAEKAKAEGKDMSELELNNCGEEGSAADGATGGQSPNSGGLGGGAPGTGNTPMS